MPLPPALVFVGKVLNGVVGPSALFGAWLKSLGHYGSDISQIDPYAIDGYRYNPADGKWYASPPQPDYGQWDWQNPAPPEKQTELTDLRRIKIEYEKRKNESPIEDIKNATKNASTIPSPIALDLDGDGIETVSVVNGAWFDHANDGFAERTGWVGKDDGLLVRDLDGNGSINSGRELFGSETILSNGSKASNGFAAIADLDDNRDGKIDANDAVFATLKIWKDANGDGDTSEGELISLADAGVQSINVAYTNSTLVDANGNAHKQIGNYTTTSGTTRAATDVWFLTNPSYSIAAEQLGKR